MEEVSYIETEQDPFIVLAQVDADGFYIDSYVLPFYDAENNPIEYGEFYVTMDGFGGFARAKWDFDLGKWVEGDPVWALQLAKDFAIQQIGFEINDIVADGFTYNGYDFGYGESDQYQFNTQMMNLMLRPTLTSVKLLTKNAGYVTFTKAQFFEIYDTGEALKVSTDDNYRALDTVIQGINDISTLKSFPPYEEAVEKYL